MMMNLTIPISLKTWQRHIMAGYLQGKQAAMLFGVRQRAINRLFKVETAKRMYTALRFSTIKIFSLSLANLKTLSYRIIRPIPLLKELIQTIDQFP